MSLSSDFGLGLTRIFSGTSPFHTVHKTICWGTHWEARRICPKHFGTRRWAHAWVRRHMEHMPLGELRVLDAGLGLKNRLLNWYRPHVKHAYLLDLMIDSRTEGNTSIVRADLEKGIPMPDASVDLVTSVSSVEHFSAAGQELFFREAERVLVPGGIVAMTVSYLIGLNEKSLAVFSSHPILKKEGFTISTELSLRRMMEAAPLLSPPEPPDWSRFPGYAGFSADRLLAERDIIFDHMHMDSSVPSAEQVNSFNTPWAEIGIFLVKS